MIRRAVFLDRDGVLVEPLVRNGMPGSITDVDQLRLLPGVETACAELEAAGFLLLVVTNQPDVSRGNTTREQVDLVHDALRCLVRVHDVVVCPHDDADGCGCRKPKPGMLLDAAQRWDVDLRRSFMVGDRWRDVLAGRQAGCPTVFVDRGYDEPKVCADLVVSELHEATGWIIRGMTGVETVVAQAFDDL